VSAGAHVNLQRDNGWSPLNAASHRGWSEFVKLMLDSIAQIDIRFSNDRTHLMLGHQDPGKFLMADGADVNPRKEERERSLLTRAFIALRSLAHAFASIEDFNSLCLSCRLNFSGHRYAPQSNDDLAPLYARKFFSLLKDFLKGAHIYTRGNFYGTIPILCALLSRYDCIGYCYCVDDDLISTENNVKCRARQLLNALSKGNEDCECVTARANVETCQRNRRSLTLRNCCWIMTPKQKLETYMVVHHCL